MKNILLYFQMVITGVVIGSVTAHGQELKKVACDQIEETLALDYAASGLKSEYESYQRKLPELKKRAAILAQGVQQYLSRTTPDARLFFSENDDDAKRASFLDKLRKDVGDGFLAAKCAQGQESYNRWIGYRRGLAVCRKEGASGYLSSIVKDSFLSRTRVEFNENKKKLLTLCHDELKDSLCITLGPNDLVTEKQLSPDEILQRARPSPMSLEQYVKHWAPNGDCEKGNSFASRSIRSPKIEESSEPKVAVAGPSLDKESSQSENLGSQRAY